MKDGLVLKSVILIAAVTGIGFLADWLGFNRTQIITVCAFSLSIFGTILFWEFRLSFAFLGSIALLLLRIVSVDKLFELASMNIIIFLIGMMVLVGFLKELGFFTWLLGKALCIRKLSARRFLAMLTLTSALLACAIDEISSIIFMLMIIFEISDYFEINPIPFVIASIMATNIGSSGTVLGNPIGLFIATKAGLTFEDFLVHAFPVMLASLVVLFLILLVIFRKPLRELDERIKEFGSNDILVSLLNVPMAAKLRVGFVFFGMTILLIAFHHRLEVLLGLPANTILFIAPLFTASIIMIWHRKRARHYIEHDVEWWSLLFFIFLFAQSGVLQHVGISDVLAERIGSATAGSPTVFMSAILFGGAFVSGILDNVVVVAALTPIIQSLQEMDASHNVLWWTLLFGACYGGNLTLIGSTANIVALGTLEKEKGRSIGLLQWLKIGVPVSILTLAFAWLMLLLFF